MTSSSISAGSMISSSVGGGASASGRWIAIPSSDQIDCTSRPSASRSRDPDRHRPRRVHARAERRQDADAPVADLVAEALDDDGPVGGHGAGRRLLVAEEREQVLRRLLVERVLARSAARAPSPRAARRARARPCRSPRRARTGGRGPRPSRTGSARARPAPGETSTRSRVISSIRHVEAPSMNVCPARAS